MCCGELSQLVEHCLSTHVVVSADAVYAQQRKSWVVVGERADCVGEAVCASAGGKCELVWCAGVFNFAAELFCESASNKSSESSASRYPSNSTVVFL